MLNKFLKLFPYFLYSFRNLKSRIIAAFFQSFNASSNALTNSSSSLLVVRLAKCLAVARQTRLMNTSLASFAIKYLPRMLNMVFVLQFGYSFLKLLHSLLKPPNIRANGCDCCHPYPYLDKNGDCCCVWHPAPLVIVQNPFGAFFNLIHHKRAKYCARDCGDHPFGIKQVRYLAELE